MRRATLATSSGPHAYASLAQSDRADDADGDGTRLDQERKINIKCVCCMILKWRNISLIKCTPHIMELCWNITHEPITRMSVRNPIVTDEPRDSSASLSKLYMENSLTVQAGCNREIKHIRE